MALTKDQKDKAANDPGKNSSQSRDQVWDNDPNPTDDNLASEGSRVKSGRELGNVPNASAPKVVKQDPAPINAPEDPKSRV